MEAKEARHLGHGDLPLKLSVDDPRINSSLVEKSKKLGESSAATRKGSRLPRGTPISAFRQPTIPQQDTHNANGSPALGVEVDKMRVGRYNSIEIGPFPGRCQGKGGVEVYRQRNPWFADWRRKARGRIGFDRAV
jgi:hypothetical protein